MSCSDDANSAPLAVRWEHVPQGCISIIVGCRRRRKGKSINATATVLSGARCADMCVFWDALKVLIHPGSVSSTLMQSISRIV